MTYEEERKLEDICEQLRELTRNMDREERQRIADETHDAVMNPRS